MTVVADALPQEPQGSSPKIYDRSTTIGVMPRPSNPEVRRRLLAAGLDLVHARGFTASGVKDITDAAGVPK